MTSEITDSCPDCGKDSGSNSWETQSFIYGMDKEAVQLTATVLVWICDGCGCRVTGEQAENARDVAVRDYLVSHFQRPPSHLSNSKAAAAYLGYVALSSSEDLERDRFVPEPPQVLVRLSFIARGGEAPEESSTHPKNGPIDAFFDGKMSHQERVLYATHLSGCSRCLQYFHARVMNRDR